jgi:uncharacterized protein
VLRRLQEGELRARYTMVCLSYRGYWKSRGRPSERGLNLDAQAALEWIQKSNELAPEGVGQDQRAVVMFWGQSIGAGVATNLAAAICGQPDAGSRLPDALILETPFLSIRAMLENLYPQKWLPYRHLWPFLRNHLDSWQSLTTIATRCKNAGLVPPRVFILEAGRDELVPPEHGIKLLQRCLELGVSVKKKSVNGAYHNEAIVRGEGKRAVVDAIIFEVKRHSQNSI